MTGIETIWTDAGGEEIPYDGRALRRCFADLATGDLRPLEELWDLCGRELYGLALWHTGSETEASDAVQEVFVRLAARPQRLRAVRHPRAYLLAMARSAAVDLLRRRRPEDPPSERLVEPRTPDPHARLDAARVSRLLTDLPPKQREVVFLRTYSELSFSDIGRITGVSTFTAASRYRLAIARLRRRLGIEL